MSKIIEDSYWVIPNKILGVRKPTRSEEVNSLSQIGMGGIISLLDNTENHELYKSNNIDFQWLPIKGGSTPELKQIEVAYEFAKKTWTNSKSLVIHCSGGRKRTAVMIASLLIKEKMSPQMALDIISKANPEIKLNDNQLQFIKELNYD